VNEGEKSDSCFCRLRIADHALRSLDTGIMGGTLTQKLRGIERKKSCENPEEGK
jgi:hypothetical protein